MLADLERRLREDGFAPAAWSNGPGDRYPAHQHDYDKIIVCTRGAITFDLPATSNAIALGTGDRLDLPAGTRHDAAVGSDGVTCLEVHLRPGTLEGPRRRAAGRW